MNLSKNNLTDEILEDILFNNLDINGFGKKKIKFNITDPNMVQELFVLEDLKKKILRR